MTSRDTSADTTLDNANEGAMSREFKKWAKGQGIGWTARTSAFLGWNARQPEIDALKAELAAYKSYAKTESDAAHALRQERMKLRAENERLKKENTLLTHNQQYEEAP